MRCSLSGATEGSAALAHAAQSNVSSPQGGAYDDAAPRRPTGSSAPPRQPPGFMRPTGNFKHTAPAVRQLLNKFACRDVGSFCTVLQGVAKFFPLHTRHTLIASACSDVVAPIWACAQARPPSSSGRPPSSSGRPPSSSGRPPSPSGRTTRTQR